ncbi:MAG: hypothetical protein K9H49_09610 [Bacteroidales bacterium]|nr:hypothetical protein [Bacteroidales bacterium]MCF8389911.1 hypothetical protein [Bacteroidales bacterium]
MKKYSLILWCFALLSLNLYSQGKKLSATLEGQLIGWTNFNFGNSYANQWGGRYIPELSFEYKKIEKWKFDGEFSLNAYGVETYKEKDWSSLGDLKPYRAWLRYSTEQFELRGGLQKINFGSANMLRPLMWFDKVDPRDPLGLTDGVNALLARYYFLNNANVWAWILYGNEDPRGWDMLPSDKKIPEMGGRIQYPVLTGEMGLSYHHRSIGGDSVSLGTGSLLYIPEPFSQTKMGIDGKWDVGPGIMIEYVVKSNDIKDSILYRFENQLSLGIDYTFGLGNGLTAMMEHFIWSGSRDEIFNSAESFQFTALNITYPVGILDNIAAILYYSWGDNSWYRFVNWSRQYDKLSLYFMAYWNPENFNIIPNSDTSNLFSGKGIQIMFSFNY